ncbi:hypothetical protein PVAND_010329 [Polypedilum vanderplanki]|uniref:DNA repair protein REV1 n=1 Tax=Polypedilum vanderplanki TaxID=319348 RepID=A0A9J6CGB2_POLVA|nr:hypothetical protein PVAND_010329 [Polypedilum vanderplanki]
MKRRPVDEDNGFAEHGGYMSAKINKLEEQFSILQKDIKKSNLFEGVSIFVNGRTNPSADELKRVMMEHGGIFHHYQRSFTRFVIASNLADVKIRSNITKNIIRPEYITDCLKANKLLDYSNYLLHTNKNSHQPQINFKKVESKTEEQEDEYFDFNLDSLNQKIQNAQKEEKTGTAYDKNYLQEFLNNSRLHCISTMASSFKFYITDLRKKHKGNFPEREILKTKCSAKNFQPYKSVIMHIDMDCFFVSVGLRNKPHLKGIPIAVTHSRGKSDREDFMSFSEIASCSYEAREKGLRNGMFVGQALKFCPELKTIPYEFEEYRKTAYKLYDTIAKYTLEIEAVSCDELYADLTSLLNDYKIDLMQFISMLRNEIFDQTLCTCSVGIGANRLQARMATKKAKPNGQFEVLSLDICEYMKDKRIRELPGVGHSTEHTLQQLKLETCGQLQEMSLVQLQHHFGKKFGESLHMMAKGIDDKKLNYEQVRKSVSVDVNYGIRFNDDDEVKPFLKQICEELSKRLNEIEKKGKCVTLKIMMRAKNASAESIKFLGHGEVDKVSKSVSLHSSTSDPFIIFQNSISMLTSLNIPAHDLRGIGIQISKLDDDDNKSKGKLAEMFKKMSEKQEVNFQRVKSETSVSKPQKEEISPQKKRMRTFKKSNSNSNLTSVADMFAAKKTSSTSKRKQIDPDILAELPSDIVEEILRDYDMNDEYEDNESNFTEQTVEVKEENEISDHNIFMRNDWRTTIISWIEDNLAPEQCMIETLSNDLVQLIKTKNLELPFLIMRFLHRHAENSEKIEWQKAYNTIHLNMQNEMKNCFDGKQLSTPKIF